MLPHPTLDAPAPLQGSDDGSFAQYTVETRLPDLLRRTLQTADLPAPARAHLQALQAEIPDGWIRAVDDPAAPDADDWTVYVSAVRGRTWRSVPWFFAETYFYRRILEATGYFGGPCPGVDPFAPQKATRRRDDDRARNALAESRRAPDAPEGWTVVAAALEAALWGNRADLSMWPGNDRPDAGLDAGPGSGTASSDDALLADDRRRLHSWLDARAPLGRVDFILDNVGVELAADLALATALLETETADRVLLHAKPHPTFISDATSSDAYAAIGGGRSDAPDVENAFTERLQAYADAGRLGVTDHLFWTSPLPGWGLFREIYDDLEESDLIISKGDANYRRWLGDRHWAPTDDFSSIVDYAPAPLLMLRTLKSDVIAGLDAAAVERARNRSESWKTDGTFGIIQFAADPAGHPAYRSPAAADEKG